MRTRTGLVNRARGLTKSYGERLRDCYVRNLNPEKAEGNSPVVEPLLSAIEELRERISSTRNESRSWPNRVIPAEADRGRGHANCADVLAAVGRSAGAATWTATWGCSQDAGNRDRVSRMHISK